MTAPNPYRGEVAFRLLSDDGETGRDLILRYSWPVMAQLRAAYGERFDMAFNKATQENDIRTVAAYLVAGLSENENPPGLEEVMGISPPVIPTVAAISDAIGMAMHGPAWLDGEDEEPADENPPTRRPIGFWSRFGRRSAAA